MHPNYTLKKPKLLYIDRYGNFYPDCKTYKSPVIGHICDPDIVNKVHTSVFGLGEEPLFNMITVEVSSECHAKCFYCFQEDGRRGEKYPYYIRLMDVLKQFRTYWLFFSGGEILDQKDAMKFIAAYREQVPDTWIHLKTNGNASLDKIPFIEQCCNSIMVSFNGFTQASCCTLMKVNLQKTIDFCEAVSQKTKANLCVKFLNSPICVAELPEFMEWAIRIQAKAIAVQTVYEYVFDKDGKSSRQKHVFEGLDSAYWKAVYERVAMSLEQILEKEQGNLNHECCNLASDKELFSILPLSKRTYQLFRTDGVYIIE